MDKLSITEKPANWLTVILQSCSILKLMIPSQLTSYKKSFELADKIWKYAIKWSYLVQKTVGEQMIRASDSIAANIAEGEGRYFKKDKIRFF